MKMTLVILAAGLGSRYGGIKQVEGLGPCGEAIMAYSAYDGVKAGFERVVFIIKPEILDTVKALCGDEISAMKTKSGSLVEVVYVYQDYSSIPDFYKVPVDRRKPFGTVHATLCAKDVVDGPFALINADDYYGAESFGLMLSMLRQLPTNGHGAMLGYRLDNTVSPASTVTRGICTVDGDHLVGVEETYHIQLMESGRIFDIDHPEAPRELEPDSCVSMSFWGFTPWIFQEMEAYFDQFLRNLPENCVTGECLLPVMVDHLLERGTLTMRVRRNNAQWFGITCQGDRPQVMMAFQALHDAKIYETPLFKRGFNP